MILFIHGFASSGLCTKAKKFCAHFGDTNFLSPSLSFIPADAMYTIDQLISLFIKRGEEVSLIGASLGGLYSLYFSQKYNIPSVLINPVTDLSPFGSDIEGEVRCYDGSSFNWSSFNSDSLRKIEKEIRKPFHNSLVFIKKGDEVIDYKLSAKLIDESKLILEDGGDHAFNDIDNHFDKIDRYFREFWNKKNSPDS